MTWLRFLDSPLSVALIAGVPTLLIGPVLLFVGIHIGEGRAPEVSRRRLGDSQRKVLLLTSALAQSELALVDAKDVRRAVIGATHDLEITLHKHVNRMVEATETAVRAVIGCADQPTAEQRAKRRTA